LGEQCDRVLQRFWGFVVNRVQVRISSMMGVTGVMGSPRPLYFVIQHCNPTP
jgi:hypothetical protein